MSRRNDDYDWIFDFALQFLESDKFDAAVMDFVDEKCDVFTDDDENKFIYTDIHKEFCEHIESLITSNLGELGITNELFLESCEKGRQGRDINTTVYERLTAMDDFQTFKKIMAKRNTELQLESIRTFKVNTPIPSSGKINAFSASARREGKEGDEYDLLTPEEMMALLEADDMCNLNDMDEEDIQDMLLASLMEMEFMHRQEELEHLELERALTLSMALEEERLRSLMAEQAMQDIRTHSSSIHSAAADVKGQDNDLSDAKAPASSAVASSSSKADSRPASPEAKHTPTPNPARSQLTSSHSTNSTGNSHAHASHSTYGVSNSGAEPKLAPLRELKPLSSKPLPSIGSGALGNHSSSLAASLGEKKKATEEALRRGQEQLAEQRRQEEALRNKVIASGVDAAEMERRAQHMREQREALIAKKKAARNEKVQVEEERMAKKLAADQEVLAESIERVERGKRLLGQTSSDDKHSDVPSAEEVAEARRANMRNALARRMKMDLIEGEEAKISQLQEDQFSELDQRLKQVEQLREDNRKREYMLNKQVERQQAQIARNVRLSAAELQNND